MSIQRTHIFLALFVLFGLFSVGFIIKSRDNHTSVSTILTTPLVFEGNKIIVKKTQELEPGSLNGKKVLTISYNLHGICLLNGPASTIVLTASNKKTYSVSLVDYGKNCAIGDQTVAISLDDFNIREPLENITTLGIQFWSPTSYFIEVKNIKAYMSKPLFAYGFDSHLLVARLPNLIETPPPGNQWPVIIATSNIQNGSKIPLPVEFRGEKSYDPDHDSLFYYWDLGDGNVVNDANANHTYFQAGTYTAQFSISDGYTIVMAEPIVIQVGVSEAPTPLITPPPTPSPSPVPIVFQPLQGSGEQASSPPATATPTPIITIMPSPDSEATPTPTPTPSLTSTPTPTPTLGPDTTQPRVSFFDVQPRTINSNSAITASFTVTDGGGSHLNRVSLNRAPYSASNCNTTTHFGCAWSSILRDSTPINTDSWSSTLQDTPANGTWWYGLGVYDNTGRVSYEPAIIEVAVNAKISAPIPLPSPVGGATGQVPTPMQTPTTSVTQSWPIRSVSSMKVTKDVICNQPSQSFIDSWITKAIELGVNYIAIETPYDNPTCGNSVAYTKAWANAIHARGLNVWHRHMPLAFEGIYDTVKSTSINYISLISDYIKNNPTLFQKGDIFTPIPEPQNGGIKGVTYCPQNICIFSGAAAFNTWLRDAITASNAAFIDINLGGKIKIGYYGFDGFVAWGDNNPDWDGILEDSTVQAMGNITIDHYPELVGDTMANDLNELRTRYPNIPIIIGEWGTVLDNDVVSQINNSMQAALRSNVVGFNYWHMGMGGNEAIINSDFSNRIQFDAVKSFFTR